MTLHRSTVLLIVLGLALHGCGRQPAPPRVEGQVQLAGRSNFEGARVFVPGTARVSYTDGQGRFVLDRLPLGEFEMVVEMEGYQPVRRALTLEAGETYRIVQPIQLSPFPLQAELGGIRGTVVLEDQEEREGTMVMVQGQGVNRTLAVDPSSGLFAIESLLPGRYQLHAFKSGYVTYGDEVEVAAGEDVEFGEIVLAAGESVRTATRAGIWGRVTLEDSGDASGVLVSVEGTSWLAMTDESGRFELSGVSLGRHDVAFQKSGYETEKVKGVVLRPGSSKRLEVALASRKTGPQSGAVKGFVQFEGGFDTDLSGIKIVLEASLTYQTTTAANGGYLISAMAPGLYRLRVEGEGIEPYDLLGISIRAGETTSVPLIVLSRSETLVSEEMETQLAGIALLDGRSDHQGTLVQIEGTNRLTTTDSQGLYTFQDVPTGVYRLAFHHAGFRSEAVEDVQILRGQSWTLGPVTLFEELERPYVLETDPADRATGVKVDEFIDIIVVFSQRMDGASVKRAVTIMPPVKHQVYFGGGSTKSDADRLHIRFFRDGTPTIELDQEYMVRIDKKARSLLGVEMEEPHEFSFRTSGPLIVYNYPEDGADDVFLTYDDYIILDFNTRVDYASFMKSLSINPRADSEPILLPEKVPAGARVKLEIDLKDDTLYTVTVSPRVRTPEGKRFDNTPYQFSFRTGSIEGKEDAIDDLIFERDFE